MTDYLSTIPQPVAAQIEHFHRCAHAGGTTRGSTGERIAHEIEAQLPIITGRLLSLDSEAQAGALQLIRDLLNVETRESVMRYLAQ